MEFSYSFAGGKRKHGGRGSGKSGNHALLGDFQAEWESPAFGLFHGAAFSTALLPTNTAIEPYFQLDREYPLFNEVRGIVAKTIGAVPLIARSLKNIRGIDEAYLYGSFAHNQQDAASDIDVLVVGTPQEESLAQAMRKLERQLGREINYTVLSRKELESRRHRKDASLAGC